MAYRLVRSLVYKRGVGIRETVWVGVWFGKTNSVGVDLFLHAEPRRRSELLHGVLDGGGGGRQRSSLGPNTGFACFFPHPPAATPKLAQRRSRPATPTPGLVSRRVLLGVDRRHAEWEHDVGEQLPQEVAPEDVEAAHLDRAPVLIVRDEYGIEDGRREEGKLRPIQSPFRTTPGSCNVCALCRVRSPKCKNDLFKPNCNPCPACSEITLQRQAQSVTMRQEMNGKLYYRL